VAFVRERAGTGSDREDGEHEKRRSTSFVHRVLLGKNG
jgi:hypothetical protein